MRRRRQRVAVDVVVPGVAIRGVADQHDAVVEPGRGAQRMPQVRGGGTDSLTTTGMITIGPTSRASASSQSRAKAMWKAGLRGRPSVDGYRRTGWH